MTACRSPYINGWSDKDTRLFVQNVQETLLLSCLCVKYTSSKCALKILDSKTILNLTM